MNTNRVRRSHRRRTGLAVVRCVAVSSALAATMVFPAAAETPINPTPIDPATTVAQVDPPLAVDPVPVAPPPVQLTPIELWAKFVELYRASLPGAPAGSGAGRRMVYSIGQQRVWLIGDGDIVEFSYLVSGRAGLPAPGSYRIFSRSRYAGSGSVTMQYMMRFAHGRKLAIGFHSIPARRNGSLLQTLDQLGTFRSHGCVRQRIDQARLAWDWAPLGTPVTVVR